MTISSKNFSLHLICYLLNDIRQWQALLLLLLCNNSNHNNTISISGMRFNLIFHMCINSLLGLDVMFRTNE